MSEPDPDDDPQLKSLRAVWLSLPDEDPPERGLAELMAAARAKAEVMGHPSWWQRVLDLVRKPTVLAFATIVVLVSGAVLIGNRKEAMDAESTAPASAPAHATTPAQGAAGGEVAPADAVAPSPDLDRKEEAKPAPPPAPPAPLKTPPRHGGAEVGGKVTKDPVKSVAPPEDRPRGKLSDDTRQIQTPAQEITTGVELQQNYESPVAAPAPAPPPPPVSHTGSTAKGKPAVSPGSSVADLVAQSRAAASRGDCGTARALASQVARQDPAAYKQLAGDASFQRCIAQTSE